MPSFHPFPLNAKRLLQLFAVCLFLLSNVALQAKDSLILGVHPYITAQQIVDKFKPLADYLSKSLDKSVEIRIAKDYAAHIQAVGKDELDIAYMGPSSYVALSQQQANPLLARLEINGKPTFRGALVVGANSSFKTLKDLQGKRFAFGSPHSTMSHLVPRYLLHEAGLAEDIKQQHEFLGNHDSVALSILMGEFDLGAVKEAVYHKYQERGLKLLQWTPKISEHVFVASKKLPATEVEAIRQTMFKLSSLPEGEMILHSIKNTITALVPVKAEDYDNLRKMLSALKEQGIPE